MTREEACNSMTLQDAIQVFRDTNAYGTMDIAKSVILKALEQQPSEDCIRRSDIGLTDLEILMCNGDYKEELKMLLDKIKKAPSVNPQPKTGHWIYSYDVNTGEITWSKCSKCGNEERGCAQRRKYCPECGARMRGEQKWI